MRNSIQNDAQRLVRYQRFQNGIPDRLSRVLGFQFPRALNNRVFQTSLAVPVLQTSDASQREYRENKKTTEGCWTIQQDNPHDGLSAFGG